MEIIGMKMNDTLNRLVAEARAYVDASPAAVAEMEERLGLAARKGNDLLSLARLGRGLTLVNPRTGDKMAIDAGASCMPQEQLEAIDQIAFYLGWVSFNFSERTIMANALVLDQNRRPTPGFLRLAQATGKFSKPLRPRGEEVFFHANECKRVFGWFAQLPHGQALPEQAGR